jgi:hypothetical protein
MEVFIGEQERLEHSLGMWKANGRALAGTVLVVLVKELGVQASQLGRCVVVLQVVARRCGPPLVLRLDLALGDNLSLAVTPTELP